jgi:tRNA (guanine37-N1)-methyltransferase
VRAFSVVVPVGRGEEIRRVLRDRGLLVKHLKVVREGDRLFLPTIRRTDVGFPIAERDFDEAFVAIPSYKDLLHLPTELEPILPSSFDLIGDIAVLKIPEPLQAYRREIGEAFLDWNRKIRVVAHDRGVEGEYRIRKIEVIAGEPRTTTVHTEYGLRYRVDVSRAYFSPRLGTERARIASLVRPGETVVDPFAGVGPYAILIAKRRTPSRVLANDANPIAVDLLRENVARNRADKVVVRVGDARAAFEESSSADRIILDLPHSAKEFLADAVRTLKPGGTVHVYAILERAEIDRTEAELAAVVTKAGRQLYKISNRNVRAYSPTMDHRAFDITVD